MSAFRAARSPLAPLPAQLTLTALLVLTVGCAGQPSGAINGPARGQGPGYEWPPRASYGGEDGTAPAEAAPTRRTPVGVQAKTIREPQSEYSAPMPYISETGTPEPTAAPMMQSSACLDELSARGVNFTKLDKLRGVEVPIEVKGALGGVTFWTNGDRKLQMDCRLALALDRLGHVFSKHGVTRARYSGAYVYKTTRGGRLSHHAHGLAIDIHEFTLDGQRTDIEASFGRNLGCRTESPTLNQLSCELRESAVFDEFLTPDYNYDHRDHLHISVPRR